MDVAGPVATALGAKLSTVMTGLGVVSLVQAVFPASSIALTQTAYRPSGIGAIVSITQSKPATYVDTEDVAT